MLTTTLANLRAHTGRLLLSSVAIVLGTAFVAGTFMFTDAARAALTDAFADDLGRADVVVTAAGGGNVPDDVLPAVRQVGGVTDAHGEVEGYAALHDRGGRVLPAATVSVASSPAVGWPTVTAGRLPDQAGEVVLDRATAQRLQLQLSDTIPVGWAGPDSGPQERQALRIIGLVDPGGSPRYAGRPFLGVTTQQAAALPNTDGFNKILTVGAQGVSTGQLAERIAGAVGADYQVRTAEAYARAQVSSFLSTGLTTGLLAFAGIALFVAAIVIANTFSILLAQRTREMALLRCVGASRGQVFRSVLAESAALGLVGSVAGVLVGFGLAYGVGTALDAAFARFPFGAVTPSITAVGVPLVVGVAVTVGAALLPAHAATRIPPVAALGEQGVPTHRAGRVRLAAAVMAVGAAGLALGATTLSSTQAFAVVFVGGVVAFLGVLLAAPVLIPPLVRLAGVVLGRLLGTPGRLAAVNTVRNPRRAAATTAALLVGATLISVLTVGAASTRATVTATVNEKFAVDYKIGSNTGVPASVVDDIRAVPGLSGVTVTHGTTTQVQGRQVYVGGYNPQKLTQVTSQLPQLSQLEPGKAVLYEPLARRLGLGVGDALRIGGSRAETVTLTVSSILPAPAGQESAFLTQRDLTRLFPNAPVKGVFAQAAPGADLSQVGAAIDRATAGAHGVTVAGNAKTEATYTRTLDTVLLVLTALVAVAMLIAVIGIANTLALSVIERTRESGLLRALGLTRTQLRATLAVEATLLSLIGALLGVGLGIAFGWAAITSILGSTFDVVLAVPGLRLAVLVAVAVAAGLLASVLPARRAARASVVTALHDE